MDRERVWRRLVERASTRKRFVAGRFVQGGGRLDELPVMLDCSPLLAWHVAVCFPPRGPEDVDHWTTVVSRRFGLDPGRVRRLAERLV
jgi:hypothetical protein